MTNLTIKIALGVIIVAPYILLLLLLKDFTAHYETVINTLDFGYEVSYYLGCVETNSVNFKECKNRSKVRNLHFKE